MTVPKKGYVRIVRKGGLWIYTPWQTKEGYTEEKIQHTKGNNRCLLDKHVLHRHYTVHILEYLSLDSIFANRTIPPF